ncbi:hypothetical protein PYCCODRAFT_878284 [Trametes coccinea BRFM310]|uniref:Uncharacterized protein n=1 Tax=Trametes coccinea (strain BRFM310) TaxID=1353009 RepID=A0A1Y2IEY0_TRAC3|nr:hypothetical protein PYCCODRAFT_878284 [Trametes coccinea BRFM310]
MAGELGETEVTEPLYPDLSQIGLSPCSPFLALNSFSLLPSTSPQIGGKHNTYSRLYPTTPRHSSGHPNCPQSRTQRAQSSSACTEPLSSSVSVMRKLAPGPAVRPYPHWLCHDQPGLLRERHPIATQKRTGPQRTNESLPTTDFRIGHRDRRFPTYTALTLSPSSSPSQVHHIHKLKGKEQYIDAATAAAITQTRPSLLLFFYSSRRQHTLSGDHDETLRCAYLHARLVCF